MRLALWSRGSFLILIGLLVGLPLSGCGESAKKATGSGPPSEIVVTGDEVWKSYRSTLERNLAPATSDLPELVRTNHEFTLALYRALLEQDPEAGNLLVSPLSIRMAFAMVYAGTRTETEAEIAAALRYTLGQDRLHNAYNALDLALAKRNRPAEGREDAVELCLANSFWGLLGFPFRKEYLDLVAFHYGCGIDALDFAGAPDASREIINGWVEERTRNRIEDLLPEDSINDATVAVLADALYLKAPWACPFYTPFSCDADFHLLDGSTIRVPIMASSFEGIKGAYAAGPGYRAAELPCRGRELSMVILLPDLGLFPDFEANLDPERLDEILGNLGDTDFFVSMPKFSFESSFSLKATLQAMGMVEPFRPCADFSGLTDSDECLWISEAYHKTFIAVDEKGLEAAAATAVVIIRGGPGEDAPQLNANRPFLFLIRDRVTGAILFFGRVLNPAA